MFGLFTQKSSKCPVNFDLHWFTFTFIFTFTFTFIFTFTFKCPLH